jgi:hypothetical protein
LEEAKEEKVKSKQTPSSGSEISYDIKKKKEGLMYKNDLRPDLPDTLKSLDSVETPQPNFLDTEKGE